MEAYRAGRGGDFEEIRDSPQQCIEQVVKVIFEEISVTVPAAQIRAGREGDLLGQSPRL